MQKLAGYKRQLVVVQGLTYLLYWLQCSCNDIASLMYVLFHVEKVAQK